MEENNVVIEEKDKKNTALFVLKIVGNVIFYLIIVVILLFSIANIRGKNERDNYPNIFGKGFLTVESDSMDGNFSDSFQVGDLIVVNTPKDDYVPEIGDIITYADSTLMNDTRYKKGLNTHRVVYITSNNSYFTMGDKALKTFFPDVDTIDELKAIDWGEDGFLMWKDTHAAGVYEISSTSLIKGTYSGTWNNAGTFFSNLTTPLYFGLFICIPVIIFLAIEVFRVYKNIKAIRDDGKEDEAAIDKEALKEQLRAELLKELKYEAKDDNTDLDNNDLENDSLDSNDSLEESKESNDLDNSENEPLDENLKEEKNTNKE